MTYDLHALHSSSTTYSKWPVLPIIGLALTSLKINTWCRLDRETSSVRNPLTSSLAPEMACSGATPAGTRIRWIPAVCVDWIGAAGGRATGGSDDGMEPENKDKIRIRLIRSRASVTSVNRKKLESPEWRAFVWWGCCLHWISSFLNSTGKCNYATRKIIPIKDIVPYLFKFSYCALVVLVGSFQWLPIRVLQME